MTKAPGASSAFLAADPHSLVEGRAAVTGGHARGGRFLMPRVPAGSWQSWQRHVRAGARVRTYARRDVMTPPRPPRANPNQAPQATDRARLQARRARVLQRAGKS